MSKLRPVQPGEELESPDIMPTARGTRFGDCEILSPLLGFAGMGEVYRARDKSLLGGRLQSRFCPGALASDAERLRKFEQEAKAAAWLSHPKILVVYRFGTTDSEIPYLVTELLQGQTLRERRQPGRFLCASPRSMPERSLMACLRRMIVGLPIVTSSQKTCS